MLVSSMVTVLGLAFVIGILSHSFQRQLMNELKKEAVFISRGVEAAGTDYLDQLSNTDSRITYVDESGKVLYDNEADVENMENHGHRKEIREAELNGEGEDERMSSTLSEKTMYYALRLDNGNVLRVSSTQKSAFALVWQLVPPLLGVLFLILVLSAVFASRLSGRVVEPLNNLDLEHPEEINVYEEVEPLISKIYRQNRQIRLQLEAARRQQKEFSIITENMQEGLLVIDRYTMVLSGNSSVGKLLKVNEIRTGESVYLLNRSEDFRGVVEQVLEGNHEDKILRLDGSDIQVIANPVTRENKTEGAVILLVDVTEKVEREQLRREFSANVSHELKTPLTSIRVLADSLMGMENTPAELYQEFMQDISAEIDREGKIIDDLLTLVKMDKSSPDLNIAQTSINGLLEQILKRLTPIAKRRNIEITYESKREVSADVDEVKLSLALSNLVENAIKYNREEGKVWVTLDADHKFFYVKVEDNGVGIPKEFQERVFERFYRVDKARSRETGGTGLGLAITKNIILLHQGAIRLKSEEGKGATFTVRIPLNYIP